MFTDEVFVNRELRFRGKPDGIRMARGRLQPIEIKNHATPTRRDQFELAFYWLLLRPYRSVHDAKPVGCLILRNIEGGLTSQRLKITNDAFDKVRDVAAAARATLAHPPPLHWHDCDVCSQYPAMATPELRNTADLCVVNGVGPKWRAALQRIGIVNVGDLAGAEAGALSDALSTAPCSEDLLNIDLGEITPYEGDPDDIEWEEYYEGEDLPARSPSAVTIERWKAQAEVFIANKPRVLPNAAPLPGQYLALDLEYDGQQRVVWSICVQSVGVVHSRRLTVIADEHHQGQALRRLGEFLSEDPQLPILTWGGHSADLPSLSNVSRHHTMPADIDAALILADLERRHLDLLAWTRRAVLLPTTGLNLKKMASYFHIPNPAADIGGRRALTMWNQYRRTHDEMIMGRLIGYNRSDVTILAAVANHLKSIHEFGPPSAPPLPLEVDELARYERPFQ